MSNLITTIIGIALAAVTTLMGLYFLADASPSAIAKSRAAMLMNESQQVYAAAQLYMADKGLSSFSDVSIGTLGTTAYLNTGNAPIIGLPVASTTWAYTEVHCGPVLDNIRVYLQRSLCKVNGKNAVVHFFSEDALPAACYASIYQSFAAKPATDPLVGMCLKINAGKTFPAGTTFGSNGLPYGTGTGFSSGPSNACNGVL